MNTLRLHASAENLTSNFLLPHRASIQMTPTNSQEVPPQELENDALIDLIQEFQNGTIRKPEHFNVMHFLTLLLYDSYGYPRDRYPLWRWYHRIKKKIFLSKHITIDNDNSRECIINVIEHLIDTTPTISKLLEEIITLEQQYLHLPIHGLFESYTCLHTYLYLEQIDKPILNKNEKLFNLFRSTILKSFRYEYNDLIHFSIVHRKTKLLDEIFHNETKWLDLSINSVTERGWKPLHYASYVGDKETVKTICEMLTSQKFSSNFDALSLFIPDSKQNEFEQNPNEYILKACGVERDKSLAKQPKIPNASSEQSFSFDSQNIDLHEKYLQQRFHSNSEGQIARDLLSLSKTNLTNSIANDNDIPDADELELSSLPLLQRDEFIDKIIHGYDKKQMLVPSPLVLACIATCGEKADYEEIVKILLESRIVEFDGINHESILSRIFNYMHVKKYASFQHVQVYRDTEIEGPSAFVLYQFDGFIVSPDVKPVSGAWSGSSATLNTSKNDETPGSDDEDQTEMPITVRCYLTVLVLRDIFLQYPRWDFHLLRENIEENFVELENALGCRPTILYPDGEVVSSRKHSDVTWEVTVNYRLSSETGQSLYMQVHYYFFESFGDPLADALANVYQTPFYISCITDSTVMMDTIFYAFFKRRNLHCWGNVAQKHLEHCFDGVLQIKNNYSTFLSLCNTLSRYYQVDGDPFIEENSATIQRIFVHAFASCVRRNAKIELDYLIKNHSLIYYDSCRTKPSDIRHNILTYCVVRNLANVFDQLMTQMKTAMYKTYQNSTNPDWQPHIAWREIIHIIIDPVSSQQIRTNDQIDLNQLACYGDGNINSSSIGSMPILHSTGDEYFRCIIARNNAISKAKKRLPRDLNDFNKQKSTVHRINSLDQQQPEGSSHDLSTIANNTSGLHHNHATSATTANTGSTKRSRNIFKNVNRLRWGKNDRNISNSEQNETAICLNSAAVLDDLLVPSDTISLVSIIYTI